MKEDITQLIHRKFFKLESCGLVMKEDITQPMKGHLSKIVSCGLVMKEDITQHLLYLYVYV